MEINPFLVFIIPFSFSLFYILAMMCENDDGIIVMLTNHKLVILAFIICGILTFVPYDPGTDWNTLVMLVLSISTFVVILTDYAKRLILNEITSLGIVIYSLSLVLVSVLIVLFSVILMRSIEG